MHPHSTGLPNCWRCGAQLDGVTICPQCKARTWTTSEPFARTPEDALAARRCWQCNKVLFYLYEFQGRVEIDCRRCKAANAFNGSELEAEFSLQITERTNQGDYAARRMDRLSRRNTGPLPPLRPLRTIERRGSAAITSEELVRVMEERWATMAVKRAQERAKMAVGLRFQVFCRDGFRCRYCGLSVDDGAVLHADHVYPESKGGPTTLENLVTACMDCNLGKRDRVLEQPPAP